MEEAKQEKAEFIQTKIADDVEDKFSDNDKMPEEEEDGYISIDIDIGFLGIAKEVASQSQKIEKKQEAPLKEEEKVEATPKIETEIVKNPNQINAETTQDVPQTETEVSEPPLKEEKEESKEIVVEKDTTGKEQEKQILMKTEIANQETSKHEESKVMPEIAIESNSSAQREVEERPIEEPEQSSINNSKLFYKGIKIFSQVLILAFSGYFLYSKILKR